MAETLTSTNVETVKTEEIRVGFAATSFLEKLTDEHISMHTVNGVYEGDPYYLIIKRDLQKYNRGEK